MSDGGPAYRWEKKAIENLNRWGEQSLRELLLATQEELGELTQAVLEADAEDGDPDRIQEELDDLGALMYQLQGAVNRRENGEDFHEITVAGTTFAFESSSVPASSILEEAGATREHHLLHHAPTERVWVGEAPVDVAEIDELWVRSRGRA